MPLAARLPKPFTKHSDAGAAARLGRASHPHAVDGGRGASADALRPRSPCTVGRRRLRSTGRSVSRCNCTDHPLQKTIFAAALTAAWSNTSDKRSPTTVKVTFHVLHHSAHTRAAAAARHEPARASVLSPLCAINRPNMQRAAMMPPANPCSFTSASSFLLHHHRWCSLAASHIILCTRHFSPPAALPRARAYPLSRRLFCVLFPIPSMLCARPYSS